MRYVSAHGYRKKCVISGEVIELYEYERVQVRAVADGSKSRGRSVKANDYDKARNRFITLSRAKRSVRRLINSNIGAHGDFAYKFMTLTFKDNVSDIAMAMYEFKLFIKRLNHNYGLSAKYLGVIEFQKRGAVHFHVVFFNLPYIDVNELGAVWGHGFIKLNSKELNNLGSYVTKYMIKDVLDKRLQGKKCYFCSRGLVKPVEIIGDEPVDVALCYTEQVWATDFKNEFQGDVHYSVHRKEGV